MSNQSIRLGFAALLAVVGLLLGLGGIWLIVLGGSFLYLVQGVAFGTISTLVWTRNPLTLWAYALLLLFTLAWAVLEVGLDWVAAYATWGILNVALGVILVVPWVPARFDRASVTPSSDRAGLLLLARWPSAWRSPCLRRYPVTRTGGKSAGTNRIRQSFVGPDAGKEWEPPTAHRRPRNAINARPDHATERRQT